MPFTHTDTQAFSDISGKGLLKCILVPLFLYKVTCERFC